MRERGRMEWGAGRRKKENMICKNLLYRGRLKAKKKPAPGARHPQPTRRDDHSKARCHSASCGVELFYQVWIQSVEVAVSQLKAVSCFGNARLQQTLVMWTFGLFFLPQPPLWAFQKCIFRPSLSFLSEGKHESLKTWFRDFKNFFILGDAHSEVLLLFLVQLLFLSLWTAHEKYDSSHLLGTFSCTGWTNHSFS